MNKYIYILFISIFFLEWRLDSIPRAIKWVPEILFMVVTIFVLVQFATKKPIAMQGKYLFLIIFNALLIVIGISVNMVEPGVIFNGARSFIKFVPLFLLPAVYPFSDEEIKKQLKFLFVLVLIQVPFAIYQRFFIYKYTGSGDLVDGTVGNSKILSGILLWTIAIIFAHYLKQKISIRYLVVISITLLITIALSETAGSLFLLPLAFIFPLLFSNSSRGSVKLLFISLVTLSLLLSVLVVSYDRLYGNRWGSGGIVSLILEGKAVEYESDTEKGGALGIGRLAAINRAVEKLWELDPIKLFIGVGMGNASDSFNKNLKGDYYEKYREDGILKHSLSMIIWSFGLIGAVLFFVFWLMIFLDAKTLSKLDNISGILALGFLGILGMFLLQTIYINLLLNNLLGGLFAYFAGLIAAQRVWLNTR